MEYVYRFILGGINTEIDDICQTLPYGRPSKRHRTILLWDSKSLLILDTVSFGLATTIMILTNVRIMLKKKGTWRIG